MDEITSIQLEVSALEAFKAAKLQWQARIGRELNHSEFIIELVKVIEKEMTKK